MLETGSPAASLSLPKSWSKKDGQIREGSARCLLTVLLPRGFALDGFPFVGAELYPGGGDVFFEVLDR